MVYLPGPHENPLFNETVDMKSTGDQMGFVKIIFKMSQKQMLLQRQIDKQILVLHISCKHPDLKWM